MHITWNRLNLTLRHPFQTAIARRTHKQTLWVRLVDQGTEGWGEATPSDLYGQSLESAENALQAISGLLSDNRDLASPDLSSQLSAIEEMVDGLIERFDDQRAAVAAVDAALYDWLGKRHGAPLVRVLGLDPQSAPLTSFTVGITTPEEIQTRVAEARTYPIWKVKIGTEDDEIRLALIRAEAPHHTIRVDANTAWPAEQALDRLRRVIRFNPEFVEQPCARDDLDTLRRLKQAALCPIVADESCVRPADVKRLAGCVDGINIKLTKCGGITEARRMIAAARRLGLRVMLGCMIESSLGVAAAAQLAPLVDWIDLDG
jgi:L-alanine-DL-glutamate epimerase-like enolase superfamily enzyme